MTVIKILKIGLIVILCCISSVSDIRRGIIANKTVAAFFFAGLIVDLVGWIFFDFSYMKYQMISIIVASVISVILYVFHIWAGGDCKLMLVISLIVPYEVYIPVGNAKKSLIVILAIIFGISYVYLLTDSIICAIKRKHTVSKKKLIERLKRILVKWVCGISYIALIDQMIMIILPEAIRKYSMLIIITNISVILIVGGFRFLQKRIVVAGVMVTVIVLKIGFNQPVINKFMVLNYLTVILFTVLRIFIDEYNRESINTSDVKKGMILSTATTLRFVNSRVKGLPSLSTEDLRSRLTEEEVESVRRWGKSKYEARTVEIIRKMPFAVFISAGTFVFLTLGVIMQ